MTSERRLLRKWIQSILVRVLPCPWQVCSTASGTWGCRCGRRGRAKKAEERAADLERQARERATSETTRQETLAQTLSAQERQQAEAERQRVEAQFQPSPEQTAQLQRLFQRTQLTPEQLYRGISPFTGSIQDLIQRRAAETPEQLFRDISPLAGQYADIVQRQLGTPPQVTAEDTLTPALQLAQQQQAAYFNRRGLLGSGLEREGQTRAAQELAIREAQFRADLAQRNQELAARSRSQALNLIGAERTLGEEAFSREADLAQLQHNLSTEERDAYQNYLQSLRSQQLSGVQLGEDVLQQGLGRGFSGQQAALGRGFESRTLGEQQASDFSSQGLTALQNRVEQARQRDESIAQALGAAGGSALGGVLGGPPGAIVGGRLGGGLFGGGGAGGGFSSMFLPRGSAGTFSPYLGGRAAPISADELLAIQRGGFGSRVTPRSTGNDLLDALSLIRLQGSGGF